VGASMIEKTQISKSRWLDLVLWVVIAGLTLLGSVLLYYYREQISVFRLLFTFIGTAGVVAIASQTTQGKEVRVYANSAWVEMLKVVWPKADEAKHISIVVVCAVCIITTIMWMVDSLLTVMVRGLLG